MIYQSKKQSLFSFIKVISTVLIASAIALELGNIYATITNIKVPLSLEPCFLIGRFAMAIHFVEGVIAAFNSPSRKQTPIKYGVYTFFVGTVGLLELFNQDDN
ncbi:hypothetical protein [Lyngbya aestuarii]|uniref:hypothetical protein n=1 Tax=Lyngbya aestuarii TaxID=118322 RepID=UPI00403D7384